MPAKAFEPYQLAGKTLKNRIVMAPMTRSRAPGGTPTRSMATYYAQRAAAGLIITEGTQPSVQGQGYTDTPGLHSPEQVSAWRTVTDAVHAEGGVIFAQLMHSGRIGHPDLLPDGLVPVAPSPVRAEGQLFTHTGMQDFVVPKELTEDEILATIQDFASAARNAVAAGFDGIELHGANGYLIHQFLSTHTNRRDDRWGGSVGGRIRFAVEVARATSEAIGADRVGIRISPGAVVNDINDDPDHDATFMPLLRELAALDLAYLHLAERAGRDLTKRFRVAWPNTLILNPDTGSTPTGPGELQLIEDGTTDLLAFGTHFIANPDLPHRLATQAPLAKGDRRTFFGGGDDGYIDYPPLPLNDEAGVPS
jgi:N-ethylmaleimide reductase